MRSDWLKIFISCISIQPWFLGDPWLLLTFVFEVTFAELPLLPEELTFDVVALDCFTERV